MEPSQQFQLFDPGPPVNQQGAPPRVSSQAVAQVQAAPSNKLPAGMRGSVTDRIRYQSRVLKSAAAHDRVLSDRKRGEDGEEYASNIMQAAHPQTGLPQVGDINTHVDTDRPEMTAIGFGADHHAPHEKIGYWAPGSKTAWRRHAKVEFVPTPALQTPQPTVSAQRLNEVLTRPDTGKGLNHEVMGPDLPRVFHDRMHDSYTIIDGNHRLSADLLQGKLFSEARVARSGDVPAMMKTSQNHGDAVVRSNENIMERGRQDFVYDRLMNRNLGTGNW